MPPATLPCLKHAPLAEFERVAAGHLPKPIAALQPPFGAFHKTPFALH
jgi:hypothetical protein